MARTFNAHLHAILVIVNDHTAKRVSFIEMDKRGAACLFRSHTQVRAFFHGQPVPVRYVLHGAPNARKQPFIPAEL